jgi:hypothetical protein
MLYGREPRLPIDVTLLSANIAANQSKKEVFAVIITNLEVSREIAAIIELKYKEKMKDYYDKSSKPVEYEVGDCVYVYIPHLSKQAKCRK